MGMCKQAGVDREMSLEIRKGWLQNLSTRGIQWYGIIPINKLVINVCYLQHCHCLRGWMKTPNIISCHCLSTKNTLLVNLMKHVLSFLMFCTCIDWSTNAGKGNIPRIWHAVNYILIPLLPLLPMENLWNTPKPVSRWQILLHSCFLCT